jgi:signal transduction histidine kinase
MTSHELKTPLTSILGYSELLSEGVLGEIHPNQEMALDGIVQCCNYANW